MSIINRDSTVVRAGGAVQRIAASPMGDGRWRAAAALQPGDRARVEAGGVRDTWGETNGQPSEELTR